MSVELNHTIVWCGDKRVSADFVTGILGLPDARPFGPFLVVELANNVSLDFDDRWGAGAVQHYAFLIGEGEFDEIFARIEARGIDYWADPQGRRPGEINRNDGGRGFYFKEPSGHFLEVLTRPYGSGG